MIYRKVLGSTFSPGNHTHSLVLEENFADRQKASTQNLECVQNIK